VLLVTATLAGTPIAIAVVASKVLKVEKQVVHPSSVVMKDWLAVPPAPHGEV
jgi:hypothetical protein